MPKRWRIVQCAIVPEILYNATLGHLDCVAFRDLDGSANCKAFSVRAQPNHREEELVRLQGSILKQVTDG